MCHFVYSVQTLYNLIHIFEHVLKYQFTAVITQQWAAMPYIQCCQHRHDSPKTRHSLYDPLPPHSNLRHQGHRATSYRVYSTIQGVDKADLWLPINRSIVPLPPTCEFCEWVLARPSDPVNHSSIWAKLIADKKDLSFDNV